MKSMLVLVPCVLLLALTFIVASNSCWMLDLHAYRGRVDLCDPILKLDDVLWKFFR